MAQAYTPSRGAIPVIFSHHPDAELWPEETTIVPDGPYTVTAQAGGSNRGALRVVAYATDAAVGITDTALTCERGGMPLQAALVWSDDAGTTTWGWNPPMVVEQLHDINAGALVDVGGFDVAVAYDGALVCVVATTAVPGTGTLVTMFARPTVSDAWAARGFAIPALSTSGSYYPAGYGAAPCLVPAEDGSLFLLVQRHQQAGAGSVLTRLDVYRAEKGADFAGGTGTLFQAWAPDAATFGAGCTRAHPVGAPMRAAAAHGQCLLLLCKDFVGTITFEQYASADGLGSFQCVGTADLGYGFSGATPLFDVATCAGFFVVAFVAYENTGTGDFTRVKARRLGSAFDSVDFAEAVDVGFGNDVALDDGHPPRLSVDEDGVLRLFVDTATGTRMATSNDAGRTWETGAVVVHEHVAGRRWVAASGWKSRTVLATTNDDSSTTDGSLLSVDLGGYATHPQPREPDDTLSGGTGRLPWSGAFWGTPDGLTPAWLDFVAVGAPTVTFPAGPLRTHIVCGVGDQAGMQVAAAKWTPAWTPSVRRFRAVATATAGTVHVVASSTTIGLRAEWGTTAIVIKDVVAGTTLATIPLTIPGAGVHVGDIILELDEVAADGRVLFRENTISGAAYTVALDWTALTAGVGTNKGGIYTDSGDTADVYGVAYAVHEPAYNFDPAVPYGREIGAIPVEVGDGLLVRVHDGPAVPGDTWALSSVADYDPARAACTIDWPSPRDRCRSSTASSRRIAYKLAPTAISIPRLWGVWIEGYTAAGLYWHDGVSGWTAGPVLSGHVTGSWSGDGITASSDLPGNAEFVEEDELAGGWLVSTTALPAGAMARIVGNSSGSLRQPATGTAKLAVIRTETTALTAFDVLVFPRICAVIDSADVPATAKGFAIFLANTLDNEEGLEVDAKLAVGPAYALGLPHGRNGRRTYEAERIEEESADGRRWSADPVRPPETTLRVSWQDMPDPHVRQTRAATAPDYVADSQNEPVYARGEAVSTLRAVLVDAKRTGRPMVYVPRWVPADGTVVYKRLRAGGHLLGTIEQGWVEEHAGAGDEYHKETLRGGELLMRELV